MRLIDVAKNLYINKSRKDYNKVKKEVEKILKKREVADVKKSFRKYGSGKHVHRNVTRPAATMFKDYVNTWMEQSNVDLEDELIEHFQDYKDGIQLKKAQLRQRATKRNSTVLGFVIVFLLIVIIISTTIRILND